MLRLSTILFLLAFTLPVLATQAQQACHLDLLERPVLCGQIEVPLDHSKPQAESSLSLHYAIIKAIAQPEQNDPLFVFTGGPGQAALDMAAMSNNAFKEINFQRDIVLIDQRGTGRSHALPCQTFSMNDSFQDITQIFKQCFSQLPIDPKYVTSLATVKDTEIVRAQLGYETINLWGGSYGTRSAQLYAFTYPKRVRSIILDAPLAINANALLHGGTFAVDALQSLIADCQNNHLCHSHYPHLKTQLQELFEHGQERYQVDPNWVKHIIRVALYAPLTRSLIPFAVSELIGGNPKPIETLPTLIPAEDVMYIGATLSILCQEDVYPQAAGDASKLKDKNFIGDSYFKFWQSSCGNKHAAHKPEYLTPEHPISTPTLILSGQQDPITPPASGQQAQAFLSNSQLVVMKHGSHIISTTGCVPKLMTKFIQTLKTVDASCVDNTVLRPFYISQQQLNHREL